MPSSLKLESAVLSSSKSSPHSPGKVPAHAPPPLPLPPPTRMPTRATTPEPQLTVLRPTQGFADDDDDDSSSISSVDSDTGSESYVVEAIVRRRVEKEGIKYFVKWEGYDESQNTWEPEEVRSLASAHEPGGAES